MANRNHDLYEFGPFRMDTGQQLLLRDGQPVPLQPKAFEILLLLIRNSERVVLKDELLNSVWANTFVQESNLTQNIFVLRKALEDGDGTHRYIVTVPGRGYRFAERVRTIPAREKGRGEEGLPAQLASTGEHLAKPVGKTAAARPTRKAWFAAALAALGMALAVSGYLHFRRGHQLTDKDTVILADFANATGDPVFEGTLRQGLSIQLEQSPFLNLLSDQRIGQTLSLMALSKNTRLTPELAREVCQRTTSAAVLSGYIANVGTRYLLALHAVNCSSGNVIASVQAQASDKDHVLDALGKVASEMRTKLGESLKSVENLDTPLADVTTPSLAALQAYSLGRQAERSNRAPDAESLYERAVSLDPRFAMAYAGLGVNYFNQDEASRAADNMRKAYELRGRVSERERLFIEIFYAALVTGDFEAAVKSDLLLTQIYPRDAAAFSNLGTCYGYLGEYDKDLEAQKQGLTLNPGSAKNYSNLVISYLQNDRLDEANAVAREAKRRDLDSPFIHSNLYQVAFLAHDTAAMDREAAQVMGKPDSEDLLLYYESDTAAYDGQFAMARQLTLRAANDALHSNNKETAADYQAEAALREALAGNLSLAKRGAAGALELSNGRDVEAIAAIALGLAGDSAGATRLADDLAHRFPQDTVVRYNSLPAIKAAIALRRGEAARAIDVLAGAAAYETGQTAQQVNFVLYPVYLRGQAYLAEKRGPEASVEFEKILDHPGTVQNEPIGALGYLGLGRAYVLSREMSEAKGAYEHFLALWKGADSDLPILRQAKAEYAKLP